MNDSEKYAMVRKALCEIAGVEDDMEKQIALLALIMSRECVFPSAEFLEDKQIAINCLNALIETSL